ncbi:MAG: Holliday junction branch migration protein RuvA [Candidatus Margulisiibacteriota bacterium]
MISHLVGNLEHIDHNHIVVEVGNVGYHINVPSSVLSRLPKIGEKVKLFTVQIVREDEISLYGFLSREERALFSLLISVNGVGPKLGLALLSGFPIDRLVAAIAQGDVALLSSVPGVGRKTAERIIVELKEKIGKTYALKPSELTVGIKGEKTIISDAISALIALGYSPREAREVIGRLDLEEKPIEEVIKEALKVLA